MRWEETQAHDDCVSKGLEVRLIYTSINNVEEYRRRRCRAGQGVFNGGIFGEELRGQVSVGDVLIMWRKSVPRETEWADPELSSDVDLAIYGQSMNNVTYYADAIALTSMD